MKTVSITEEFCKEIAKTYLNELESEKSGDYLVNYCGIDFIFRAYITKQVVNSRTAEDSERGGGFFLDRTIYDYCYILNDFWVEDENCNDVIVIDILKTKHNLTKNLN